MESTGIIVSVASAAGSLLGFIIIIWQGGRNFGTIQNQISTLRTDIAKHNEADAENRRDLNDTRMAIPTVLAESQARLETLIGAKCDLSVHNRFEDRIDATHKEIFNQLRVISDKIPPLATPAA